MKRFVVMSALSALLLVYFSAQTAAMSAVQPSDADLVVGARAIVSGEVLDISTAVQNNIVYSYIRLRVEEVFKGNLYSQEVVLKQPGGECGDLGTMIYGMPRFDVGRRVLVYLDTWGDGALRVHQWFLGKYDITPDPLQNQMMVSRGDSAAMSVSKPAGTVSTLSDSLDSYREMVKRLLKANREKARAFEQAAYGGTPLLAEPVEYAGLQGSGQVVPQWVAANQSRPLRWFEADSHQTVTFYVNGEGAPVSTIVDDVAQALNAWSQLAGTSLRLTVGTSSGCGVQNSDSQNTISFTNCDNYFSPSPGCGGVLAVGGIVRYSPSQTKTIGGMTFAKAVEANVAVNPYSLCSFGNRCDLIETLTHEVGHALGLGHSPDSKATMYGVAQFNNRCSGLLADDLEGIRFLYPADGNSGVNIQTSPDLPTVEAGQPFSTRLEASGGSGNYSWRLAGGMLPPGLTMNVDGTVSGATDQVGACNFLAEVRDGAGRTSQMPFALTVRATSPGPVITGAEFRKKKVFLYGANFTPSGAVYIDDALTFTFVETNKITTLKRKLKGGVHTAVVKDSFGRESNRFTFTVQ